MMKISAVNYGIVQQSWKIRWQSSTICASLGEVAEVNVIIELNSLTKNQYIQHLNSKYHFENQFRAQKEKHIQKRFCTHRCHYRDLWTYTLNVEKPNGVYLCIFAIKFDDLHFSSIYLLPRLSFFFVSVETLVISVYFHHFSSCPAHRIKRSKQIHQEKNIIHGTNQNWSTHYNIR